jgi:hypothetical protein
MKRKVFLLFVLGVVMVSYANESNSKKRLNMWIARNQAKIKSDSLVINLKYNEIKQKRCWLYEDFKLIMTSRMAIFKIYKTAYDSYTNNRNDDLSATVFDITSDVHDVVSNYNLLLKVWWDLELISNPKILVKYKEGFSSSIANDFDFLAKRILFIYKEAYKKPTYTYSETLFKELLIEFYEIYKHEHLINEFAGNFELRFKDFKETRFLAN